MDDSAANDLYDKFEFRIDPDAKPCGSVLDALHVTEDVENDSSSATAAAADATTTPIARWRKRWLRRPRLLPVERYVRLTHLRIAASLAGVQAEVAKLPAEDPIRVAVDRLASEIDSAWGRSA